MSWGDNELIRPKAASRYSRGMKTPLLLAFSVAALAAIVAILPSAAETARQLPPPALDEKADTASRTAVFAGGCFWGVQGVYQHVDGVLSAVSGYAGGEAATAQYEK